jgi:hypothetical protein
MVAPAPAPCHARQLVSPMTVWMKQHQQEGEVFPNGLIWDHEESRAADDGKEDLHKWK